MTFILSAAGAAFVISQDGKAFEPLSQLGNEIRFIRPQTVNATKLAIDPASCDEFLRDFGEAAAGEQIDWQMEYNTAFGQDSSGYNLAPDIQVVFYSQGKEYARGDMQSYAVTWAQGLPLMFPTPPDSR